MEQFSPTYLENAIKVPIGNRNLEIGITAYPLDDLTLLMKSTIMGRGISEENLERVFELFRRSGKLDQPGEVIGLAHVRTLVRNLKGDVTLEISR